jgi:hypothetical protein
MLTKFSRLNFPNIARFAGVAIASSVNYLASPMIVMAETNQALQKALLSLFPTYGTASLLREYANECDPTGTASHQAAYDRWLETHRIKGVQNLLYETIGDKATKIFKLAEQGQLKSKLKESFPNCLNAKQLAAVYANPSMNPAELNPSALAVIQAALSSSQSNSQGFSQNSPQRNPQTLDRKDPVRTKPPQSANNPDSVNPKPNEFQAARTIAPLKGIYMEQVTGYGVGGMVTFDFDSFAIFEDGTISKNLDEAFGGQTTRSPKYWGQWQQNGKGFNVNWNNGTTQKLGGNLFYLTFPATASDRLDGLYRSIGGGGNTALGGDIMIIDSKNIRFYPDGTFDQTSVRGGSSSQTTTRSKNSASGTYMLNGHMIQLRYPDGRVLNTGFFFFPAKGVKTADSIGIGSRVYSRSRSR